MNLPGHRFLNDRFWIAVILVTLTLGIGATATMVTVVNALIAAPLPGINPAGLVSLWHEIGNSERITTSGYPQFEISYPLLQKLQTHRELFSSLAGFAPLGLREGNAALAQDGKVLSASITMVSGTFFSTLQTGASLGRTLDEGDEGPAAAPVAVISYRWWRDKLGGKADVLGQKLEINSIPYTIIGVASREFCGIQTGQRNDIWIPFTDNPAIRPWGSNPPNGESMFLSNRWFWITPVGRMKPAADKRRVEEAILPLINSWLTDTALLTGTAHTDLRLKLLPAGHGITYRESSLIRPAFILTGVVLLILFSACFNIGLLLLARAEKRRRTTAIRMALGASPWMEFFRSLRESVLLALAGGSCGLLLSIAGTHLITNVLAGAARPVRLFPQLDAPVLLLVLGITGISALLFGTMPALQVFQVDVNDELKGTISDTLHPLKSSFTAARSLIVWQGVISVAILVVSVVLLKSFYLLEHAKMGFDSSHLTVFRITSPPGKYPMEKRIDLYGRIIRLFASQPEVPSVTLVENRLIDGVVNSWSVMTNDHATPPRRVLASWNLVGPDFLRTTGIPLLLGRDFNAGDSTTAVKVAIVNRKFAEEILGKEKTIGSEITIPSIGKTSERGTTYRIIGVSGDAKYSDIRTDIPLTFYIPYTQATSDSALRSVNIEVKSNSMNLISETVVQRMVGMVDQSLLVNDIRSEKEQIESSLFNERMLSHVATACTFLTLLLVSLGIYGTSTYMVGRRVREIGIRMALGATRTHVLGTFLRKILAPTLLSLIIGIPVAIGLCTVLSNAVYGIRRFDPIAIGIGSSIVFLFSVLAAFGPVRRAVTINPQEALRAE
jgi:predicted permease